MLNITIIEDEKPAARRLQRMLAKEGLQVGAMLHSVSEASQWFNHHQAPDLILADIQLSDGLSFDIFKAIPLHSAIIFTTAYDQYAIKAFKLNSIDYLLKPIKQADLHFAIQKFKQNKPKESNIHQLIKSLQPDQIYKKRFIVQYGAHLQSIPIEAVAYFYSQDKATWLVTHDGDEFICEPSLEALEPVLHPEDFFRANRQFIISRKAIKDITQYGNSRLKIMLTQNKPQTIIVARQRVKAFKVWLA